MSIRSNVDARALNERIVIERNGGTQDSTGDTPPSFSALVHCWARVDAQPVSGPEPDAGGGTKSLARYTFWIRADIMQRFALLLTDRIVWRARVYDIKDIPDQQLRGRLIALIAEAGLTNG